MDLTWLGIVLVALAAVFGFVRMTKHQVTPAPAPPGPMPPAPVPPVPKPKTLLQILSVWFSFYPRGRAGQLTIADTRYLAHGCVKDQNGLPERVSGIFTAGHEVTITAYMTNDQGGEEVLYDQQGNVVSHVPTKERIFLFYPGGKPAALPLLVGYNPIPYTPDPALPFQTAVQFASVAGAMFNASKALASVHPQSCGPVTPPSPEPEPAPENVVHCRLFLSVVNDEGSTDNAHGIQWSYTKREVCGS